MYHQLQNDHLQITSLLNLIKEKSISYLSNIDKIPTSIVSPSISKQSLPIDGIGLENSLTHFYNQHFNKIIASSGPRYWGYVTGGTTPAAIAGDWLTSVFDQNTQSTQTEAGDFSASIELETIDMLLTLFGLPNNFLGGFVTGATMSNLACIAVGRQWAGKQKGLDIAREGMKVECKILAASPHSSSIKALSILGIGSNNIIAVKTLDGNREAIDIQDLEAKLMLYKNDPCILISSGGTVNTVDYDDMQAISLLHKKYSFYWHIDAAFGGFAILSEKHKYLLTGWENADSITIDCHKWMNVPYDSAIYFIQKKHAQLQMQTFQNSNAPYLGNPEDNFSYLNFGPENSRRFRALPAWFSLMAYGKNGFQSIVEHNITMAQNFGERIEKETMLQLAAPVRLNVVCFTTKKEEDRKEVLTAIQSKLLKNGKVFITPTVYKGIYCLRAAFVNWRTSFNDIDIAINELLS